MSLLPQYITVPESDRALEYVDGVLARTLDPGRHRRPARAEYRWVSTLTQITPLATQDVPTSEGVSVRVSAAVRWSVTDAERFVAVSADPLAEVYLAVQVALRDAFAETSVDDAVRAARGALGESLTGAARAAGEPVGIAVAAVVVKDVVLPAELRAAYAELLTAKARGLAQLEAARAETAALRSLANGAKLLEDHPALARLRLVQSLPMGSTVTLE